METNNLNDIFRDFQPDGTNNEDLIRDFESLQADVPELADIDISASDLPSTSEIQSLYKGPSSGGSALGKVFGGLFSILIITGLALWSAVSMFQASNQNSDHKQVALYKHNKLFIPELEEEEEVVVKMFEEPQDSMFYTSHILVTEEMARDDLNINPLELREAQNLYYQLHHTVHKVSRYTKEYNYKYMRNYKVYDYSARLGKVTTPEETSLDARFSDWDDYKYYARNELDYRSYEDMLYKALSYLDKERYREVDLILFSIIKTYKDDQNAWFYSGISSYRQGKYREAIECFNHILELGPMVFKPEAEWYKSLSLVKMNEPEEAKSMLVKIANSDGFYEGHAQELLLDLE